MIEKRNLLTLFALLLCFTTGLTQNTRQEDKQTDNVNTQKGISLEQFIDLYCEVIHRDDSLNVGRTLTYRLLNGFDIDQLVRTKFDSLAQLKVRQSVDLDSARLELTEEVVIKAISICPVIDSLLGYDGKQRPAYAYLSQSLCQCLSKKRAELKDDAFYFFKYRFFKDTCYRQIISDESVQNVILTANNFQSKTEVEAFDNNFRGFFFKNCLEEKQLAANFILLFKKEAQILDKRYALKGETLSKIQEENVLTVIKAVSSEQFSYYRVDNVFGHRLLEKKNLNALDAANNSLKNQKSIDWIKDKIHPVEGVTQYRVVVFKYSEQAKKNIVICQLEFDFYGENGSLMIDEFRFTPRLKVADLQKLENRINKKY
jgi:hypothetical protein